MMYQPMPRNHCSKCGEFKPWTRQYFAYSQNRGVHQPCRQCTSLYGRAYRQSDPDKERERNRQKYQTHREAIREQKREAHKRNPHKARQRAKEWAKENPEKPKEYSRRYIKRHKEEERERLRIYRQQHPEKQLVRLHRRLARKRGLPDSFTEQDWYYALNYFNGCCAVCGRPPGLWHTIAMDHWIPLSVENCPGTVAENIIPLCHGIDGCNNSKGDCDPVEWLIWKFGQRKAKEILARIEAYFAPLQIE